MPIKGVGNRQTQAAEFVTMRAAHLYGMDVAEVDIVDFAGTTCFVTKRYDRFIRPDGTVLRIHQEDFCQALGVAPLSKYQEDGGPSIAEISRLVASSSTEATADAYELATVLAFNLAVANIGAHAKNYSLLHYRQSVRVAPAYDLISALAIWDEKRIRYKGKAAMKYGKEYRYRAIGARNLVRAADDMAIPREAFLVELTSMSRKLPELFDVAIQELPVDMRVGRIVNLPDFVARHIEETVKDAKSADLTYSAVPRHRPPLPMRNTHPGEIWIPGQRRGEKWSAGSWRKLPSRRS